jgi:hypothetical protein
MKVHLKRSKDYLLDILLNSNSKDTQTVEQIFVHTSKPTHTITYSEENEELLSKFFIDIKDSLALAYEATANANVHHFNIGQKLAMLEERMEQSQFNFVLSELGLDRQ